MSDGRRELDRANLSHAAQRRGWRLAWEPVVLSRRWLAQGRGGEVSSTECDCVYRRSVPGGLYRGEWAELHDEDAEPGCDGGARNELQRCDLQSAGVLAVAVGVDDRTICDGDGSVA